MREKRRDLQFSKDERLTGKELYKNRVPRSFLVFTGFLMVVAVVSGVFIGVHSNRVTLDEVSSSYQIRDYTIVFTSEENDEKMVGNNGYTWIGSDTIYINKELLREKDFVQIERTCNHEILHTLGISGKHHNRIGQYERSIDDPVCNKLMNRITY